MAEIISFRNALALAQQQLEEQASELIDAMGCEAGYRIGMIARFSDIDDTRRRRLLALAEEIALPQGFGWCFADDPSDNRTGNKRTRPKASIAHPQPDLAKASDINRDARIVGECFLPDSTTSPRS